MNDIPLAQRASLDWLLSLLAILTFVASGCDDQPTIDDPEPVGPKLEKLKQNVGELGEKASEAIEKHQPDTGLTVESDGESPE